MSLSVYRCLPKCVSRPVSSHLNSTHILNYLFAIFPCISTNISPPNPFAYLRQGLTMSISNLRFPYFSLLSVQIIIPVYTIMPRFNNNLNLSKTEFLISPHTHFLTVFHNLKTRDILIPFIKPKSLQSLQLDCKSNWSYLSNVHIAQPFLTTCHPILSHIFLQYKFLFCVYGIGQNSGHCSAEPLPKPFLFLF